MIWVIIWLWTIRLLTYFGLIIIYCLTSNCNKSEERIEVVISLGDQDLKIIIIIRVVSQPIQVEIMSLVFKMKATM